MFKICDFFWEFRENLKIWSILMAVFLFWVLIRSFYNRIYIIVSEKINIKINNKNKITLKSIKVKAKENSKIYHNLSMQYISVKMFEFVGVISLLDWTDFVKIYYST